MPAVATAAGLPSRLGKYELLMPLAAGGMARIYIGRSTGIGAFERHVVLKMITPERANDQVTISMFLDEARLAASLNHQNVAQVFEVGEEAGIHYLAMEYVHGQDLRALLAKAGSQGTRIPLELALTVVAGAAAGLHHAHERRGPDGTPLGIVHRDVTPSNIMIGYDGAVKLLDFGIAKAAARSVETQSGIIKGKFAYMAPEQCRGRDVDRRSDVFSLGIILYEISTQHRCFRADSDFDTMHRIVTGDVVRPTRLVPGYPPALEAIVMKALATDQTQRYQSAGALLEALESFSVSSRMSLSTMGLGRFMRDMFGDVGEPWLQSAGSKTALIVPKETTVSSTDGKGSGPINAIIEPPRPATSVDPAAPEEADDGAFPDSGSIAAQTILDLPRGESQSESEQVTSGFNPKSYPSSQPALGGPREGPRDTMREPMSMRQDAGPPTLSMAPTAVTPPLGDAPMQLPKGTQPPPGVDEVDVATTVIPPKSLPPRDQFQAAPGSGSGPSMESPYLAGQGPHLTGQGAPVPVGAIPSTRHGYASGATMGRGDISYPRYEPPADLAPVPDVELRPNRRPLYIGLGIATVGIVIMLLVMGHGKKRAAAPAAAPEAPQTGSADQPTPPPATPNAAATPPSDPASDMVTIHIVSDPKGADVLIAGTKIGTTPLDTKLRRGTKVQPLQIHLDGYKDINARLDLSGDYSNDGLKLEKLDADAPADDKAGSAATVTSPTDHATMATPPGGATPAHDTDRTVKTNPKVTRTTTAPKHPATGTGGGSATPPAPKQPKCQPPGPNVDPFSPIPVCSK